MKKEEIAAKVREAINAPSCCAALKEAGQAWLDAEGKEGQKEAADALVKTLNETVSTIDESLGFFESEAGAQVFGKEQAANMAEQARKFKAAGNKYCFCPACQAGAQVYDEKELLY